MDLDYVAVGAKEVYNAATIPEVYVPCVSCLIEDNINLYLYVYLLLCMDIYMYTASVYMYGEGAL